MQHPDRDTELKLAMVAKVIEQLRASIRERAQHRTKRVAFAPAAEIAAAEHVDELTKARARALLDRALRRRRMP
jgi:hypothetical protein